MREATIRDAKSSLTSLVREAESGHAVRLTRRGKPVAVLVSDQAYTRLTAAKETRPDFLKFLQGWRREMIAKGIPFVGDDGAPIVERDRRPVRPFSFPK